jgi:hypothetical protein
MGVTYPNNIKDRFKNYLIGFIELGINTKELENHFKNIISKDDIKKMKAEILKLNP